MELLVTGVAFGLVGLDLRQVPRRAATISGCSGRGVICVVVFAVRVLWLADAAGVPQRKNLLRPPAKEVLILTWCGMRGLATLALALSLPLTLRTNAFPARGELLVIACAVLLATLVLPGLTLPWLMRVLKASEDGSEERDAARVLARRAQQAAIAALKDNELMKELPAEKVALVKEKMTRLHAELLDGSLRNESAGSSASVAANWRSPCRRSPSTRPARKSWRPGTSRAWTRKSRTGCCGSWTCAP